MTEAMNAWQPTDAALMASLAEGQVDALGPLYLRYGRMVKSLMLRLEPGLTLEQCDDLSQEVFLTLLDTAGRYQEQQRLKSWLCGISAKRLLGWRRRRWSRQRLLDRHGEAGAAVALGGAVRPDMQAGARQDLARAMAVLSSDMRATVVLHHIEGLDATEVAETLGISTNTVWTRLHRARALIRQALESG